jgi:hypothetical protein
MQLLVTETRRCREGLSGTLLLSLQRGTRR